MVSLARGCAPRSYNYDVIESKMFYLAQLFAYKIVDKLIPSVVLHFHILPLKRSIFLRSIGTSLLTTLLVWVGLLGLFW